MMRKYHLLICIVMIIFAVNLSDIRAQQSEKPALRKYTAVTVYDPARSAEKDVEAAIIEAKETKKKILLEVGGNWCVWCRAMDKFFEAHTDLSTYRDEKFIMVKINFSPENQNEALLSKYPQIPGYPHIFVLDSDGKLLHSQGTGELEEGRSYSLDKFFAFLKKWH